MELLVLMFGIYRQYIKKMKKLLLLLSLITLCVFADDVETDNLYLRSGGNIYYNGVPYDTNRLKDPLIYLDFDTTNSDVNHKTGRLYFDKNKQNLVIYNKRKNTSADITREGRMIGINTTGVTIENGKTVIISGDQSGIRTIGFANAKYDSTSIGTIGFATESIAPGDTGEIALWGEVNEMNTTGCTSGNPVYLDTIDGGFTENLMTSPDWIVFLGNCGRVHASLGSINARVDLRNKTGAVLKIFNGAILEPHTIEIVYSAGNSYLKLDNAGKDYLTLFFDGTTYKFNVPDSIQLNAGSDVVPTRNWVYISNSTKQITLSTSSFPVDEQFVPVADVYIQTVASAQTYGVYKVHAWTDHLADSVGQGHLSHVNKWIRNQNATWLSGVLPTVSVGANPAGKDTIKYSNTSGQALQLHPHSYPATDLQGGDHGHVINDEVAQYEIVTDLGSVDTDTEGNTLESNNTYYSLVVWGSISEAAKDCQLFINKPSGSYTTQSGAESDLSRYSVYTIPSEYRGTGFLIARINIRYQTSSSGTFTITSVDDLRGLFPATGAGGGSIISSTSQFFDNAFQIQNITDNTKIATFDASRISTGTTRTYTAPDTSGTIALKEYTINGTGSVNQIALWNALGEVVGSPFYIRTDTTFSNTQVSGTGAIFIDQITTDATPTRSESYINSLGTTMSVFKGFTPTDYGMYIDTDGDLLHRFTDKQLLIRGQGVNDSIFRFGIHSGVSFVPFFVVGDLDITGSYLVNGSPLTVSPGGLDGDFQYNNSGSFGGAPLTTDGSSISLGGDLNTNSNDIIVEVNDLIGTSTFNNFLRIQDGSGTLRVFSSADLIVAATDLLSMSGALRVLIGSSGYIDQDATDSCIVRINNTTVMSIHPDSVILQKQRITNVGTPVRGGDAVNKDYVDNNSGLTAQEAIDTVGTHTFDSITSESYIQEWDSVGHASTQNLNFHGTDYKYIRPTGIETINITGLPSGESILHIEMGATGYAITIGTGWGTAMNGVDIDDSANAINVIQFQKRVLPGGSSKTLYWVDTNNN